MDEKWKTKTALAEIGLAKAVKRIISVTTALRAVQLSKAAQNQKGWLYIKTFS